MKKIIGILVGMLIITSIMPFTTVAKETTVANDDIEMEIIVRFINPNIDLGNIGRCIGAKIIMRNL